MRIGSTRFAPLLFTAILFSGPLPGFAATTDVAPEIVAVIDALRAEIAALNQRLEVLEKTTENPSSPETRPSTTPAPNLASQPLQDQISIKGDFRYRHEAFEIENRRDRHRQRVRARVGLTARVSDRVDLGFGLASGGSDPISSNQTLGDGASSKGVVIDLAYAKWKTPISGLQLSAGKFKNPLRRVGGNSLLWDSDLRPEGVSLNFSRANVFLNALGSWVSESAGDDDSFLIGGQVGLNLAVGSQASFAAGLGYHNFLDSAGEPAFFDGDAQGNLLDAQGNYVHGFELIEGFVEYKFDLANTKVTAFAQIVQNLDADRLNKGYSLGVQAKQADWNYAWTYKHLEADAVVGTFTDSDFIGGGTDGKGHTLKLGYALSKDISVAGTLFLTDRNVDIGAQEEFKRLQLDISFKY